MRSTAFFKANRKRRQTYLGDCNVTLLGQLLLGLLRRVRVGEVRIEILVQDLRSLLAEVPSFSSRVEETRTQNHHSFTSALLQLHLNVTTTKQLALSYSFTLCTGTHLNGTELFVNNLYHPLDLFGSDWAGP